MGSAKPLLGVDDATFVERVVTTLRDGGCRDIVVVIRPGASEVGTAASLAGARVVVNPDEGAEQVDSLRLALRNLQRTAAAAVVLPVDHPLVSAPTVRALVEAYAGNRAPVVRASHAGEPGHPTLFSAAVFDDLLRDDLPEGARTLIERLDAQVVDVAVPDRGVVADIDTPEDYRRHVGGDA